MLRSLFIAKTFKNPKNQLRQLSRCTINFQMPNSNPPTLLTTSTNPIAYEKIEPRSNNTPCVIFIPGWMSGKDGDKAHFLRQHCLHKNYSYVRYDPSGIGESPGQLGEIKFSDWVSNAESVLENLGEDDNVLVGSSLGGWISILLAMKKMEKKKIKGVILIAPALNIFSPLYKMVMPNLSQEAVELLDGGGVYTVKDEKLGEFQIWKALIENIEEFEIDLDGQIPVNCPVRILHGCMDDTIPFTASIEILKCLASEDVEVVFRKGAEHAFKEPESLSILAETLDKLIAKTEDVIKVKEN